MEINVKGSQAGPLRADPNRVLRWAAIAFAIGVFLHTLDHMRRGMTASPPDVVVAGFIDIVAIAIAVVMTLRGHRRSPEAAIVVGFVSAFLFFYAHVLPTWWHVLSDSFVSMPHMNVTWFSWVTLVGEVGTGIVFGIAGVLARGAMRASARP
jgi:hypothetical protein